MRNLFKSKKNTVPCYRFQAKTNSVIINTCVWTPVFILENHTDLGSKMWRGGVEVRRQKFSWGVAILGGGSALKNP